MESRGQSGALGRSLRLRLCLILSLVGVLFTAASSWRSYQLTLDSALLYIDQELSQIADVITDYGLLIPKRWEGPVIREGRLVNPEVLGMMQRNLMRRRMGMLSPAPSLADLFERHHDIIIAPLFPQPGEPIFIPAGVEDGFYSLLINDRRVRACVATNQANIRFVVARPLEMVTEVARRALFSSLREFLVLIAIYITLVVVAVNIMFAPVRRLAQGILKRTENDLNPLEGSVPSELDGLIAALNRLFERIGQGLKRERRFIADAAHEMRTPLTALSLQAEAFPEQGLTASARLGLDNLRAAIRRQRDLTERLLTLARSQSAEAPQSQRVEVKALYVGLIEELGALADRKGLDLGVEGECSQVVYSSPETLHTILYNLLSNAIKYSPQGGRVDLGCVCTDGSCVLYVSDEGPGIPVSERERVLEPFYRVGQDKAATPGTGLGLAIAKACADALGAELKLEEHQPRGLTVKLLLRGVQSQD